MCNPIAVIEWRWNPDTPLQSPRIISRSRRGLRRSIQTLNIKHQDTSGAIHQLLTSPLFLLYLLLSVSGQHEETGLTVESSNSQRFFCCHNRPVYWRWEGPGGLFVLLFVYINTCTNPKSWRVERKTENKMWWMKVTSVLAFRSVLESI